MGSWCDQIDIFRADTLQFKDGSCQGLWRKPLTQATRLEHLVLTENTSEIAAGKKDGSGAALSRQARFLIPMQPDTGDAHGVITAAEAALDMPVSKTLSWAKIAAHQGRLPQTKLRSQ